MYVVVIIIPGAPGCTYVDTKAAIVPHLSTSFCCLEVTVSLLIECLGIMAYGVTPSVQSCQSWCAKGFSL